MWNTICYVLPSQHLDALKVSPWSDCTKFASKKQLPKNVQKKGFRYFHENPCGSIALAERVGFEPTYRLLTDNSISSRARYGHFATSPCLERFCIYGFSVEVSSKYFLWRVRSGRQAAPARLVSRYNRQRYCQERKALRKGITWPPGCAGRRGDRLCALFELFHFAIILA